MKPINIRIADTVQAIIKDLIGTETSKGCAISVNDRLVLKLEKQLDILASTNLTIYIEVYERIPEFLKQLIASKTIVKEHPNAN